MSRIVMSLVSMAIVSACYAGRQIYTSPETSTERASYDIKITIEGKKNRDILLGKYTGTDICSVDTAVTNEDGRAAFAGSKPLVPGMYAVMFKKETAFSFLISDTVNQKFSISATKDKYLETLSFEGSPENDAFADYSRHIAVRQEKENELAGNRKDDNVPLPAYYAETESLTRQIDAMEVEIKNKYPGSLLESVASAMNPARPKQGEIAGTSSLARQRRLHDFRKQRYWDKLTLTDIRMKNTPILIPAIDSYFESVIPQRPDSMICAVDFVLSKAESDTAMMKFLTKHIFDKYLQILNGVGKAKMTGIESVVIHIIDSYYSTGKARMDDEMLLKELLEYADKTRETLPGKQASNLKMETVSGGAEALYDIDSPYVLLCFFDVSCFHCRSEIPAIYRIYQKFKNRGVAGFCVYSRNDRKEWIEFISKHKLTDWINAWDPGNANNFRIAYSVYSVPQVYVLDKDKKIVGRGLESASLEQWLNQLIKNKDNE
ncbi:MAG: AhpC/TSA family protein [Prevotellaceae bacterium]|jgi:peroxiredoxin|nr:AhpC/TSA family protein [Prevotellaceae bacterium]